MPEVVTVIVTCTKDKRYPVRDQCMLRNVAGASIGERVKLWESQTVCSWSERVAVRGLYAGDHWAVVKSLSSRAFAIDVWVCSAGFGLLHIEDSVVPYAATFSPNHPDSVTASLDRPSRSGLAEEWWNETANHWKRKFSGRPRTITELVAMHPKRSVLVVASANYLKAIAGDLRASLSVFRDPCQLSIICGGVRSIEGLGRNLIPCDARLQSLVGGARRSLNTRFAAKILFESRSPPLAPVLQKYSMKTLSSQPAIVKYNRRQMTNAEVKRFVRKLLRENQGMSPSPMLRTLRESNCACEQKRFSTLYKEVKEELDG